MILINILNFFLAIFLALFIFFWRAGVNLKETLASSFSTVSNNIILYTIAFMLLFAGYGVKVSQTEIMYGLDNFYECGVFPAEQIIWIFSSLVRNAWIQVIPRVNDYIAYMRSCFSDLRDGLQMVLELDLDGLILSKGATTLQFITDLYDIISDFLITAWQWTISIPSLEIRFLTVSWTSVLNILTCYTDQISQLIRTAFRGTIFSESCQYCSFKDQYHYNCFLTDFAFPGVVIDCNKTCHDFFCGYTDCQFNFVKNITYLISNGDQFNDVFDALATSVCCMTRLLDRPFYIVVGVASGCIPFEEIGPIVKDWVKETYTCLSSIIVTFTGDKISDFFDYFTNNLLEQIGEVIKAFTALNDCGNLPAVTNCFSSWNLGNCGTFDNVCPSISNIECGFGQCFFLYDNCLATSSVIWQILNPFFRVWECFQCVLNQVICSTAGTVQEMIDCTHNTPDCHDVNVTNFFNCFENIINVIGCMGSVGDKNLDNPSFQHFRYYKNLTTTINLNDFKNQTILPNFFMIFKKKFEFITEKIELLSIKLDLDIDDEDKTTNELIKYYHCLKKGLSDKDVECVRACDSNYYSCFKEFNNFKQGRAISDELYSKIIEMAVDTCDTDFNEITTLEEYKCIFNITEKMKYSTKEFDSKILVKKNSNHIVQINTFLQNVDSMDTFLPKLYNSIKENVKDTEGFKLFSDLVEDFEKIDNEKDNISLSLISYDDDLKQKFFSNNYEDKKVLKIMRFINFTQEAISLTDKIEYQSVLGTYGKHNYIYHMNTIKKFKENARKNLNWNNLSKRFKKNTQKNSLMLIDGTYQNEGQSSSNSVKDDMNKWTEKFYKNYNDSKFSKYKRLIIRLNEKIKNLHVVKRNSFYQLLHATYYTIQNDSYSNLSDWVTGKNYYIPEEGFVNKTTYEKFMEDFNPLNPGVFQPTLNLALRNESVNIGIFISGVILSNISFLSTTLNDKSTFQKFKDIILFHIYNESLNLQKFKESEKETGFTFESLILYPTSDIGRLPNGGDPALFNFDSWFFIDYIGAIANKLFKASKTFLFDYIIKGIDYLENLDWKEDVLTPFLDWTLNITSCTWPDNLNGTTPFNPFCLPLVFEAATDFLVPLPSTFLPTQIPWPKEFIDEDGECVNTYIGNSNFIFTFKLSNNCQQQQQQFGRAVGIVGSSTSNRTMLISSIQDGFNGSRAGLVYVYLESKSSSSSDSTWNLIDQIEADNPTEPESVGLSISSLTIAYKRFLVSSPGGNKKIGFVKLYEVNSDGTLTLFQKISPPLIPFVRYGLNFGFSTAIGNFVVLASSPFYNDQRGAVFSFLLDTQSNQYEYRQILTVPATGTFRDFTQYYGSCIFYDNSIGFLIVGAPNYPYTDDLVHPYTNGGFIAIYRFTGTGFIDSPQILEPQSTPLAQDAHYGQAITGGGFFLFVGAPGYNNNRGAVYIYKFNGATYTLYGSPIFSPTQAEFGTCLSYFDPYLIVGAPRINTIYIYKLDTGSGDFVIYGITTPTSTSSLGTSCFITEDVWVAGSVKDNSYVGSAASANFILLSSVKKFTPNTLPVTRPICDTIQCDYCKRSYIRGEIEPSLFGTYFVQPEQPCQIVGFNDALDTLFFATANLVPLLNGFIFGGISFHFLTLFGPVFLIILCIIFGSFSTIPVFLIVFYFANWILYNIFWTFLPWPLVFIGFIILTVYFGLLSSFMISRTVPILVIIAILITYLVFLLGDFGHITLNINQYILNFVNTLLKFPFISFFPFINNELTIISARLPEWIFENNEIPSVYNFCFFYNFGEIGLLSVATFFLYYLNVYIFELYYIIGLLILDILKSFVILITDVVSGNSENTSKSQLAKVSKEMSLAFKKKIK
jgi:hypothetical protein